MSGIQCRPSSDAAFYGIFIISSGLSVLILKVNTQITTEANMVNGPIFWQFPVLMQTSGGETGDTVLFAN